VVDYAGNPSGQAVRPKEKERVTSTPVSSQHPFRNSWFNSGLYAPNNGKYQETKRNQEYQEKVLLHRTLQASAHSSQESSWH